MHNFRELDVWNLSMGLAVECYTRTSNLPSSERFGLQSQIRRAAASIPSNIAEGSGYDSRRQFGHYLQMSYGPACELDTHVKLAQMLGYLHDDDVRSLVHQIERVRQMLYRLIQASRSPV